MDPLLGPLADNGGPTQTHALLPGSPAINAGVSTEPFDQRGAPFLRDDGNGVDIGAFELQDPPDPDPSDILHSDLEIIAREYVYTNRTAGDPLGLDLGYSVEEVFADASGFYALGLVSEDNPPVLAFRGTQTDPNQGLVEDLLADLEPQGIGYSQFNANRNDLFAWIIEWTTADEQVTLAGHSLGGALAQWTAAAYTAGGGELGEEVVTFNSPGISKTAAATFRPSQTQGATHYITSGDVVSLAGEAFIEGEYALTRFNVWGDSNFGFVDFVSPATRHLVPVLNEELGGRLKPRLAADVEIRSTDRLNDFFFGYRDPEYLGILAAMELVVSVPETPLSGLKGLPRNFLVRGTTEQFRQQVGASLDEMVTVVRSNGVDVDNFVLEVPDFDLTLFNGDLDVGFESVALTYEPGATPRFVLQGKATVETFFAATADFQGDNFIEWTEDGFELVGQLTFKNRIDIKEGGWGLEAAELHFNTLENTIGGSAVVVTPFFPPLAAGAEFVNGELNAITVGVADDLDLRIGTTPYYLQALTGTLENFAESITDPVTVSADVVITGGKEFEIKLPSYLGGTYEATALHIEAGVAINSERLTLDSEVRVLAANDLEVVTLDGEVVLDWKNGTFTLDGSANVLDGLLTADVEFQANRNLDIFSRLSSQITFPEKFPWVGGDTAAGTVVLSYSNNGNKRDDFVAVWFDIDTRLFGNRTLGARVRFDGKLQRLGGNDIEALQVTNGGGLAALQGSGGVVQLDVLPGTPWAMFTSEWETPHSQTTLQLRTPSGQVINESDVPGLNSYVMIDELTGSRRRVVYVDSPEAGTWHLCLVSDGALGEVEFFALSGNEVPSIAISSLAGGNTGSIEVGFTALDADSDAQVTLFYDTDNQGADGVPFATELVEQDGPETFSWVPSFVEPGQYFVYAVIDDGVNAPQVAYSDTSVLIALRPGDFDNDFVVDGGDLQAWISGFGDSAHADADSDGDSDGGDFLAWQRSFAPGPVNGDLDSNGRVNGEDIELWQASFGSNSNGDANGDGDTDGGDFLAWQRGFSPALGSLADFDADGDTDGRDFLAWQRGFGGIYDAGHLAGWQEAFGDSISAVAAAIAPLEVRPTVSRESRDSRTEPALAPSSLQLIDAALAAEWSGGDLEEEELAVVADPHSAEVVLASSFARRGFAHATNVEPEFKELAVYPNGAESTREPWLADELLERVFG